MDYSKLSDYEINCRVAHELGLEVENNSTTNITETYCGNNEGGCKFGWSFRDYCNNPADAWPIIQNSGISLVYDGDDWLALHFSRTSLTYPNDHRKHPDKPFRAALILWLMMQESE